MSHHLTYADAVVTGLLMRHERDDVKRDWRECLKRQSPNA